ncbi:MAG: energy transducer TonB [Prevotella sp.]|mgnify:CR=1 FL=1|jgi:protein TonB|nr:energy transducer TonB [Prevotella sp.]MBR2204268.1 energy transducer TonB [Prevotella sp.]
MAKIDLISGSWTDLVFENRNQTYGAYVLRKGTGRRNVIAILSVILLAIACQIGLTLKNIADEAAARRAAMDQVTELSALEQKKEAKVERKEVVKQEQVQRVVEKVKSSVKFTAPVIKKDDEVKPEDELKTQDELMSSKAAIGTFDVKGNDESGEVLKAKEVIATEPVKPKEEENKVFDVVEQMPSYPGGNGALMQYLSSHIKYPVIAEENGIQGRVICTFVVERDGSITDVRIAKSVDPSLDKEAMRVVSSMPKWIPGKQNGSAVRVKYTLPVTFRLQ